ncbi:ABC transporter permease [Cellulomonas triticagri]|uniref:ABC transporter permease n=1 Tax=Cellulomonas triticagri TaxID=2483352 RepID=A0A3M2JFJ0_9CELL|nr:ABC transporter permease [Cellulomonas triticagri]RMI12787.1 ABC transporter permease [Cellulomonas triticagri]
MAHTVLSVRRALGRATAYGAAAGVAAVLLTTGLVEAAGRQAHVAERFDHLAARHVQVTTPVRASSSGTLGPEQRAAILSTEGVTGLAWGSWHEATVSGDHVESVRTRVWTLDGDIELLRLGVEPGRGSAPSRALLVGGGLVAGGHDAVRFGHAAVAGRSTVVDGVITASPVVPDLLDAVVVMGDGASPRLGAGGEIVVGVRAGWADVVAPRLAAVLAPGREEAVLVRYTPEAQTLRGDVLGSVASLVLVTSGSVLALGAGAVMVGTFFRVLAERRLLGLYRAIGARSRFVVATLVLEAAAVGLAGSVAGTIVGLGIAGGRALALGTALRVPWTWVLVASALGAVANALAALLPAALTVREPPIVALRAR